jgi:ABC-type thiamine transport system ATPase subunit
MEDVLTGQGGSVCNILSVGLRLIALSQLDPARHRPFLVLDEQDCWLRPQLVPRFMKLIADIARRLDLQLLVISHHGVDLFAHVADRVFELAPDREHGVAVRQLK